MTNRRQVLKKLLRLWGAVLPLMGIDMTRAANLLAAARKRIVPSHADPQSLRNANPSHLDTGQMPLMPLERFDTMGEEKAAFDARTWRLTIDGKVGQPLSLAYPALRSQPVLERNVLLICPGVFVNYGRWRGFSLDALLKEARPLPGIKAVVIYSDSGTNILKERFEIAEVRADMVFLAYGVNGQDLPEKHGFPLRVVAEGHYGYTWAKYVARIEVR